MCYYKAPHVLCHSDIIGLVYNHLKTRLISVNSWRKAEEAFLHHKSIRDQRFWPKESPEAQRILCQSKHLPAPPSHTTQRSSEHRGFIAAFAKGPRGDRSHFVFPKMT